MPERYFANAQTSRSCFKFATRLRKPNIGVKDRESPNGALGKLGVNEAYWLAAVESRVNLC
jgi:hypothetical protein